MKDRRFSYQKYQEDKTAFPEDILTRKMFLICDIKGRPIAHSDGFILQFYRVRDAKNWIYKNKGTDKWKIRKVQLGITTL